MAHDDSEKESPEIEEEHKAALTEDESGTAEEQAEEHPHHEHEAKPKTAKHKDLWRWLLAHKPISIPAAVLVVLAILMAVPFMRYSVLGLFLKQEVTVLVVDSQTAKPVSSATVALDGKSADTDGAGRAKFKVAVGEARLSVTKQYYKTATSEVVVPVGKSKAPFEVKLEATGRQVPVVVLNSISSQPVVGATLTAGKSEAKTDDKGQATLVVPAGETEVKGALSRAGYNNVEVTVKVTTQEDKVNSFKLTPIGKVYLLSNQSGKIDLVKSNLDGTEREIVLAGTGREERYGTVLLASRDWKYIALISKRDGGQYDKLFVIETATDKVTTADEGEATFSVYGWSGDRLVYSVERQNINHWKPKREAIKSYHAPSKKLTTHAETTAKGTQFSYAAETFSYIYLLDKEVLYTRNWQGATGLERATLDRFNVDGSQKQQLKRYHDDYLETRIAEFGEVYIQYYRDGKPYHDAYEDGKLTTIKSSTNEFYSAAYPSYLVSPSGKKTLWSDFRDGQNVFFVGDGGGGNGKQVGSAEDFRAYGWFTDDYLLLTKKDSEMRIMPAASTQSNLESILKIGNYYKPDYYRAGFGYGYGG